MLYKYPKVDYDLHIVDSFRRLIVVISQGSRNLNDRYAFPD